jgi:hypothetical protein
VNDSLAHARADLESLDAGHGLPLMDFGQTFVGWRGLRCDRFLRCEA